MSNMAELGIREAYKLLYARVEVRSVKTRAATVSLMPIRNFNAVVFIFHTTYHHAQQPLVCQ